MKISEYRANIFDESKLANLVFNMMHKNCCTRWLVYYFDKYKEKRQSHFSVFASENQVSDYFFMETQNGDTTNTEPLEGSGGLEMELKG